mmetsp:Transcript_35143/g.80149  ORF Transcript_35143/g.80149 Transcript_35143/m.80149 type:complete len:316 (-) Transcript_35143:437-1384(-)|eukprot:CAMPEP_0114559018 /NCGR_PEP_ID=MMETSP0114-20121206/10701_1 /TAXON_ID=31324 /ORGANISM="Goniomonas sp, Strain m" /LENGTH=315 /DNA_ID=CAMNT_0001744467 /DNA_START=11 /DNA_END=958 /DNA_ORIENTATION=-
MQEDTSPSALRTEMPWDVYLTALTLLLFWLCLICHVLVFVLTYLIRVVGLFLPRSLLPAVARMHPAVSNVSLALRQSRFFAAVTYMFATVMCLQILLGTPIPITYVAGHRMCHGEQPFCDGDAVIMSAHGTFGIGDSVLLRANATHLPKPKDVPDAGASTQLRLRRVLAVQKTGAQWKLQVGTSLADAEDEAPQWIPSTEVLSVAYLRIPYVARPIRHFQRAVGSLNAALGVGAPYKRVELHQHLARYFFPHRFNLTNATLPRDAPPVSAEDAAGSPPPADSAPVAADNATQASAQPDTGEQNTEATISQPHGEL